MALFNRLVPHVMKDLERSFERAFEDPFWRLTAPSASRLLGAPTAMMMNRPAVDLKERKDSFVIEAELPGVQKSDVSLEFSDNNTLTLKGRIGTGALTSTTVEEGQQQVQQREEEEGKDFTYWNQERMVGSFQRSFTFPTTIDSEKVNAALKDGILTVTVPKTESKTNKIEIKQIE